MTRSLYPIQGASRREPGVVANDRQCSATPPAQSSSRYVRVVWQPTQYASAGGCPISMLTRPRRVRRLPTARVPPRQSRTFATCRGCGTGPRDRAGASWRKRSLSGSKCSGPSGFASIQVRPRSPRGGMRRGTALDWLLWSGREDLDRPFPHPGSCFPSGSPRRLLRLYSLASLTPSVETNGPGKPRSVSAALEVHTQGVGAILRSAALGMQQPAARVDP